METQSDNNLPAIACRNLQTDYQSTLQRPILNGIDLQINHGEFVALLGLGILFRVQFAGKRILAVAAAALLAITGAVIATYPFAARWSRGNLEMTTLDVG